MTDVHTVDVFTARPQDLPPEWEPEDRDQLAELRERLRPDPRFGLTSPAQWRLRTHLAGDRWFLLKNVWGWKSNGRGRSGAVEEYFTLGGVERPFNGLDSIYGLFRDRLTEEGASALFGDALKLGAIEPISPTRARRLSLRILAKTGVDLYPRLWTGGAGG